MYKSKVAQSSNLSNTTLCLSSDSRGVFKLNSAGFASFIEEPSKLD